MLPAEVGHGPLLVATWDHDALWVDGARWDHLPRGAEWAGRTVYLVGFSPWSRIGARYCAQKDCMTAHYRGAPDGLEWSVVGGRARLVDGDAWALPSDPSDAQDELARLVDALAWEPELVERKLVTSFPSSAAGLAARLLRVEPWGEHFRQLRPRWRGLARAAGHSGPQLALSGGGPSVVHLDRRTAYLAALASPLPVPGTWRPVQPGARWDALRRHQGIVLATVDIDATHRIGPLPVRWRGATTWPTGSAWGAWSILWLRWAEERGLVAVRHVWDAATCRTDTWLAPLAESIARIEDKTIRRLLYTRAAGLFSATGRWEAYKTAREGFEGGRYWLGREGKSWSWRWHKRGPEELSHGYGPLYRPDLGAFILAHNAVRVVNAVHNIPPNATHLLHLDSMLVDAEHAPALLSDPGWRVVGPEQGAPARVYGAGTYVHAGRVAAMGRPGTVYEEELEELPEDPGAALASSVGRRWVGQPRTDPSAVSYPTAIEQPAGIRWVPTWLRWAWSQHGWLSRAGEQAKDGLTCVGDANEGPTLGVGLYVPDAPNATADAPDSAPKAGVDGP